MKPLRNITALLLAFFVWLGSTGYTLETPPLCCEEDTKACCPLEDKGTKPACCQIEIDYVQTGSEAVFFALPDIQFESAAAPFTPLPQLLFSPQIAQHTNALFTPLPPPKISPKARTGRRILRQVQCWRL